MMTLNFKNLAALALTAFVLAGCSSTPTQDEQAGNTETVGVVDQQGGDATTYGAGDEAGMTSEELAAQQAAQEKEAQDREMAALREVRTFYFDFDKSVLKPEAHLPLKAHAAFLAANPDKKVVLNGYTDERGTKEYNLALGERRAKAVARFLVANGASPAQIEVVSYGEEFPAVAGHNEAAWAKNRRVVLEYK